MPMGYHPTSLGGSFPAFAGTSQTAMFCHAHWSPSLPGTGGGPFQHASPTAFSLLCTCFPLIQEVINMECINLISLYAATDLPAWKRRDCSSRPLDCSRWPRCYQVVQEIQAQGRPKSHQHCSSNSIFLTFGGDRWILPIFTTRVEDVAS